MKTLQKTISLLFISAALVLSSCSKDDDGDGENNNNSGSEFLTAKVDGVDFEAAQDPAVIVGASQSNNVLAVQGGKNNGETIRINLVGYTGPGTYRTGNDISNTSSVSYITLNPTANWMSTFDIGSGTVEVTKDDGTVVEGTFSFEGFNADDQTTKTVTQGQFKAIIE